MNEEHESQLDKLIRMANQIAVAFHGLPEPQGIDNVAEHIRAFWTPKMRRTLSEYAAGEGTRLEPLARAAATKL
jgi:formate dehydrogenase subunit delta